MAERGETKSAMVTYDLREEKQNWLWSHMAERGETKLLKMTKNTINPNT